MNTIQNYLDLALEKNRLYSGRELGRVLGVSSGAINAWRTGRSLPDDENMLDLARLAGIPDEQALLELSYWRAEGEAKSTYGKMLARLQVTACGVFLCMISMSASALAAAPAVTKSVPYCILW